MITKYFNELEIGEKIISRGRTLTETDVVLFCMFSGNWFQLHSDVEYVKKTKWGERLVQGTLVFAIAHGLLPTIEPGTVVAFYGVDKLRFLLPVRIGDTVHVERTVIGKEEKGKDAGVVTLEFKVKNQRDEVVQISHQKLLVSRKKID